MAHHGVMKQFNVPEKVTDLMAKFNAIKILIQDMTAIEAAARSKTVPKSDGRKSHDTM